MDSPQPNHIVSSAKFIKWQALYEDEKPFQIFIDIPSDAQDQRTTNVVYEDREVCFQDIRGKQDAFSLDSHGFSFRRFACAFDQFDDSGAVEREYLPQVEQFIKTEVEGADRVFIFDWRLRTSSPVRQGAIIDLNDPSHQLRPALHAHVDQAPGAVLKRVQLQLPKEAPYLLQGRVRVVNVWRPLRRNVEDWPIAVMNGSKVSADKLVETDHVRRLYTGSTLNVLHDPSYEWYYLDKQGKDEWLIFKNFDSSPAVRAKCCPHVSFKNPLVTSDTPNRESIEIRALVFTFPDDGQGSNHA